MRSFTYDIYIERPPEVVWNVMMDFSRAYRWRNLVRTVEVITPGPLRVGSEMAVTFDLLGKVKRAVSEVWAFEPPVRFGARNTEQNITGIFEYRLRPERTGTRIIFSCDVQPRGLMWLLIPLLIRGNRLRYRDQLTRLKEEVERS
jgi:hypothetical protein